MIVHACYIPINADYILVQAGYILVNAVYIPVHAGYMNKCHLLTMPFSVDKGSCKNVLLGIDLSYFNCLRY